jgi:hypothetical protein
VTVSERVLAGEEQGFWEEPFREMFCTIRLTLCCEGETRDQRDRLHYREIDLAVPVQRGEET